jgi:hypothetical protein
LRYSRRKISTDDELSGLVLRDHPELAGIGRLTLLQSLGCVRLVLWDEGRQRLISFREMHQRYASV